MTPADLRALCRDRRLLTPEFHGANDFYGHATVLKRFAGLPNHRSLKVAVEHGVMLNDNLWSEDLHTPCPVFLCATEEHARAFERRTGKAAFAIGPMVRYVAPPPAPVPGAGAPSTLLAFPAHSTHRVRTVFDLDAFLAKLEVARAGFDRVVVCVYWKDVLQGLADTLHARGYECVSAGHLYDPAFLPRLHSLLDTASACFTNEVGSHVLYAALAGRAVWIDRSEVRYEAESESVVKTDVPDFLEHPRVVRLLELFSSRPRMLSAQQAAFIDEICGVANVRTPEALRAIFSEAETRWRAALGPRKRAASFARTLEYWRDARRARASGGILPPLDQT